MNNIQKYFDKPKGIALVWPEDLPKTSDGGSRSGLKSFYIELINKIPPDKEFPVLLGIT